MQKSCLFALIATALSLATAFVADARPAPEPRVLDLREATGQAPYADSYCRKMQQRCDTGDASACALVVKNCSGD